MSNKQWKVCWAQLGSSGKHRPTPHPTPGASLLTPKLLGRFANKDPLVSNAGVVVCRLCEKHRKSLEQKDRTAEQTWMWQKKKQTQRLPWRSRGWGFGMVTTVAQVTAAVWVPSLAGALPFTMGMIKKERKEGGKGEGKNSCHMPWQGWHVEKKKDKHYV